MKKRRIGKYIIVGTFMILTGVVGVSAANTLTSNGVLYSNAGSSVTTVEGALNELYANYNSLLAKGNASASDILSGKTALVGGKEVTGTIASKAAKTYTPGTSNQTIASGQYLSGVQTIKGDSNLVVGNIKSGTTIFGVTGTYTSDANATASQILSGKTAYVNGSKVTGSMANFDGQNKWINKDSGSFYTNQSYTYSNGTTVNDMITFKYNETYGYGYITPATKFIIGRASDLAPLIKTGSTLLGVTGTYTSDANATASQILSGKTAYVNGNKITGTIASLGAKTYTPGTSNQTIASGKYLSGTQTIKGDSNLKAANIKKGVSIFGVTGTYTGLSVGSAVVHEKSVSSACGTDYYSTSSISAGTYIVTNMMYTNVGTGSASNMTVYNGATLLSEYKYGSCIIQIYKVVVSSTINSGSSLGRMSNCSYNSNTSSMYGRSTWVKVSA